MVSDSAALVLFAIRSALKLGQQLRLAYVDNTKRRELVLPLPNFFSSPDVVSAKQPAYSADICVALVVDARAGFHILTRPEGVQRAAMAERDAALRSGHERCSSRRGRGTRPPARSW